MRHLAATAVLCLVAAACGSDGGTDANAPDASTTSGAPSSAAATPPVSLAGTVNDHGTKDLGGNDEFELELDDFYFGPTYVKAAAGSTVKVELANEGESPHTFTIDSLKIDETLQPGKEADVDVKIPASGVLAFYCKFHKSQGMQGALYVTAGAAAPSGSADDNGGAYGG